MEKLEFYSTGEVAEQLKVSEELIRREIRRGRLAATPIGSDQRPVYRIDRADLDAYLAAQRALKPVKEPKKRGRPPKASSASKPRNRKKKGPSK